MGYIYRHIVKATGKSYIGQTKQNPETRYGTCGINYLYIKSGAISQTSFAMAILKYGWNNISHEVIAEVPDSYLDILESYFILSEGTYERGYNMTIGGYFKNEDSEISPLGGLSFYKSELDSVINSIPEIKRIIESIATKKEAKESKEPTPTKQQKNKKSLGYKKGYIDGVYRSQDETKNKVDSSFNDFINCGIALNVDGETIYGMANYIRLYPLDKYEIKTFLNSVRKQNKASVTISGKRIRVEF